MLISLSMGHSQDQTFKSNTELTTYLKQNNFLASSNIEEIFNKHSRNHFTSLEICETEPTPLDSKNHKSNNFELTSEAVNLKNGVDLTSPMMQGIMLSLAEIIMQSDPKICRIVDIGCANGFLGFGFKEIIDIQDLNLEQKTPIKIIGIDSDEAAIKKAEDLKNLFGATNIEFVSINFEEFVEQFGVKSHNFFCFGFGVERSDIIARIYLNPSNNYIWTLAPIFNEKLEQDLCLIAPKYDKSGNFFK